MNKLFNFKPLEDIDKHANSLDKKIEKYNNSISEKQQEITDLKIKLDEFILIDNETELEKLNNQLKETRLELKRIEDFRDYCIKSKRNFMKLPIIKSLMLNACDQIDVKLSEMKKTNDEILEEIYKPALKQELEARENITNITEEMQELVDKYYFYLRKMPKSLHNDYRLRYNKYLKIEYPTFETIKREKEDKEKNKIISRKLEKEKEIREKLLLDVKSIKIKRADRLERKKNIAIEKTKKAKVEKEKAAIEREKAKGQESKLYKAQNE